MKDMRKAYGAVLLTLGRLMVGASVIAALNVVRRLFTGEHNAYENGKLSNALLFSGILFAFGMAVTNRARAYDIFISSPTVAKNVYSSFKSIGLGIATVAGITALWGLSRIKHWDSFLHVLVVGVAIVCIGILIAVVAWGLERRKNKQ